MGELEHISKIIRRVVDQIGEKYMGKFDKAVQEPMELYHKHEAIGAGKINEARKSAAHYKYRFIDGNPMKDTPALMFGRLAHTAILEPKLFIEHYVIEPEFKGTGMRAAKQTWFDSLPAGTFVMDAKEADTINGMINSVRSYKPAADLFERGIVEHSLYWTDERTGLPMKCRPDVLTEDEWMVDLKTARDASMEGFSKAIGNYGFDVTAAHYLEGFEKVFGRKAKGYVFVPIEKTPPYVVSVYVADETVVGIGEVKRRKGLDTIVRCMKSGVWSGYQTEAENISVKPWELDNIDDISEVGGGDDFE